MYSRTPSATSVKNTRAIVRVLSWSGPDTVCRALAAAEQAADGRDAAAEHEARDRRADQHVLLVGPQLAPPVRDDGDLGAQLLDRHPELGAVGLDRAADLLRGARGAHQRRTSGTAVPGCWGWEPDTVSRISCASSMARTGVGGNAFLMKR